MKYLFSLIFIAGSLLTHAQQNEGIVTYDFKINMHRRLGPDQEQFKSMVPEFQTAKKQLLITATESLYKNAPESQEEEVEVTPSENQVVKIKFQQPEALLYRNFSTKKRVDYRPFFDKNFLIESDFPAANWKVSGETKAILGQMCLKATLQDTSAENKVAAWFTPNISIQSGPEGYGLLPGLILELDINDGETIVTASNIEWKKLDADAITVPDKGKKVTEEEYKKTVEEHKQKMKEMNGGSGGGPRIFIQRSNN